MEVNPRKIAHINSLSIELLGKVEQLFPVTQSRGDFEGEIPVDSTITKDQIKEIKHAWLEDENNNSIFVFIFLDNSSYGFTNSNYETFLNKVINELKKVYFKDIKFGREFILETILNWLKINFETAQKAESKEFFGFFLDAINLIVEKTVYIPIQNTRIQSGFKFGDVEFLNLTKIFFDETREQFIKTTNEPLQIETVIKEMRKDMQGRAACKIIIKASNDYLNEFCLNTAREAINLLKIYSPFAENLLITSYSNLLGENEVETNQLFYLVKNENFYYHKGVKNEPHSYWDIYDKNINKFEERGLNKLATLLNNGNLNEYERKLKRSILTFAKGISLYDINDRILFTVSALETLLIRNKNEPLTQNLSERIAYLISQNSETRMKIVKIVKKAIEARSNYIHHQEDMEITTELSSFNEICYACLINLISKIGVYKTHEDLFDKLDELKFS